MTDTKNKKYKVVIVMGTSGCGKSTISEQLSSKFKCPNYDGDDYHSESNVNKMRQNVPLNDEDRVPWLHRISKEVIYNFETDSELKFIACSALKRRYRDILAAKVTKATDKVVEVIFLYLETDYQVIVDRVSKRKDHFMKTELVKSQFEALQPPQQDEQFITVDANLELEEVVDQAYNKIKEHFGMN